MSNLAVSLLVLVAAGYVIGNVAFAVWSAIRRHRTRRELEEDERMRAMVREHERFFENCERYIKGEITYGQLHEAGKPVEVRR